MDNTLRQWDVRPFVTGSRQVKVYTGATVRACLTAGPCLIHPSPPAFSIHSPPPPPIPPLNPPLPSPPLHHTKQHGSDRNLLRASWSPDGEMVTAGSSDRAVHIWDTPTSEELYYLPGHKATVNEVVFSPTEPIVASASSDKTIFLGELA